MAQRRMIARSVYTRTKFLRLSTIAKMLYTYLILEADDDGVSEAYFVMLTVGANEDNLQELVANGFVTLVNDDLVVLINDWLEQNLVPQDRYKASAYSAELEKRGFVRVERGFLPPGSNVETDRKQTVTNTETQDRLVQDRVVQDNSGEYNSGEFNSKKGRKDEDREGGAGGTPQAGQQRRTYGKFKNVFLSGEEYSSISRFFDNVEKAINDLSEHKNNTGECFDSDYDALLKLRGGKLVIQK